MKVHFKEVGYSNMCFTRESKKELTYNWLLKQIKPYVMSRNIDFSYNEETKQGLIFGGFQTIGEFEVEE